MFARLKKHGFWLKNVVGYLGHQIDSEGVKAKLRPLSNVQELRSFLGLLNYYGKSIKNLSSILHPLDQSSEEIFRLRQGYWSIVTLWSPHSRNLPSWERLRLVLPSQRDPLFIPCFSRSSSSRRIASLIAKGTGRVLGAASG